MLSQIIDFFIQLFHQMSGFFPLPIFVFVGAFVEELVAPIPSPIVMTLAGSVAQSQGQTVVYLGWLALIGAVGKTFGSYLLYLVVDRAGDWFLDKFGRFVGVTSEEIEQFGRLLNKGWKDDVVLVILRALPIMPTAPVSIVCGLIGLNLVTYLRSTFIGTLLRNIFYLYLGYTTIGALESLNEGLDGLEVYGYAIFFILLAVGAVAFYIYRRQGMNARLLERWTGPKSAEK